MKEQLKPCPSCGAKNTDKVTLISELYDADKYKYGKCFQCGIRMYDWNKRPIEDALQAELDQLRNDNQSLAEQIHIMAEFLVAEGICPFTPCILERPHTDEDCMFCWEHRGK